MSIKPIDYHLSFNNTIYESKEKQNDFNRIRDTNTFLQHDQKNQIDRNRKRIQQSKETEGKKVNRDNKQGGKNSKNNPQGKDSNRSLNDSNSAESSAKNSCKVKGQKLDIFI